MINDDKILPAVLVGLGAAGVVGLGMWALGGPDHDPNDDLSYWDNENACWVDYDEATRFGAKSRAADIIKRDGLDKGNPGDKVSVEPV